MEPTPPEPPSHSALTVPPVFSASIFKAPELDDVSVPLEFVTIDEPAVT